MMCRRVRAARHARVGREMRALVLRDLLEAEIRANVELHQIAERCRDLEVKASLAVTALETFDEVGLAALPAGCLRSVLALKSALRGGTS